METFVKPIGHILLPHTHYDISWNGAGVLSWLLEFPMKFGVLIFDQAEELDFVGPWEMLTMWSNVAEGPDACMVVAPSLDPVICAKGLSVNPHVSFQTCPDLDYLLVPGGEGTRSAVNNREILDFVARQATNCKAVLSVCSGSFVLYAAGLLSGKRATTHWGSLNRLRALGDVTVVEERFVRDGSIWSSAGVSAGTDLMLAFIAHVADEQTAGRVQFGAEYYPVMTRYGDFHNSSVAPAYIRSR